MLIFPENLVTFQQYLLFFVRKMIFANLIQTLTSEARVLNQKHAGTRGAVSLEDVGGEAPPQIRGA